MKKSVIKIFDRVILMLLGIAGVFTGCKPNVTGECEPNLSWINPYPDSVSIAIAYGVLQADFAIRGTATSKTDGKPIPNITVLTQIGDNKTVSIDFTDLHGNYSVSSYKLVDEKVIHLKFEDIDGKENGGEFKAQEIKIKITDTDRDKMKQCQQEDGTFTKIQNVELKTKK